MNTKQTLFEEPLHPEGLERIQLLEQPRDFGLQEVPDRECDNPPKFLGNLQNVELQVERIKLYIFLDFLIKF